MKYSFWLNGGRVVEPSDFSVDNILKKWDFVRNIGGRELLPVREPVDYINYVAFSEFAKDKSKLKAHYNANSDKITISLDLFERPRKSRNLETIKGLDKKIIYSMQKKAFRIDYSIRVHMDTIPLGYTVGVVDFAEALEDIIKNS